MMKSKIVFIFLCLFLSGCCGNKEKRVENIIFIIGDGMGLAQITALSIDNNLNPLNIERAQFTGIQKTFSANNRVTDSSAAGTALATGEKANNGTVGISPDGRLLKSTLQMATDAGMATGIVVTYSTVDATPAAFFAHSISRDSAEEIAAYYPDSGIDFIAGSCPEPFESRTDGRNIIKEMQAKGYTFAPDKASILSAKKTPLLAILPYDHIPFAGKDTLSLRGDYLTETTLKALELLGKSEKTGIFLMVESSFIDWAGHNNDISDVVAEMRDFDRVVGAAFDYADLHPGTLVVVTGDHETGGLTIASASEDYKSSDAGLTYGFASEGHTATFIPVFAYGTGAELFTGVMENTDIAIRIKSLITSSCHKYKTN